MRSIDPRSLTGIFKTICPGRKGNHYSKPLNCFLIGDQAQNHFAPNQGSRAAILHTLSPIGEKEIKLIAQEYQQRILSVDTEFSQKKKPFEGTENLSGDIKKDLKRFSEQSLSKFLDHYLPQAKAPNW